MTISEMHTYFRQYAQQMGMQNVRAILPEQIDMLLNTSISDTINQIIRENIGATSDRVVTDNSKIGSINALRSLYRVGEELICLKHLNAESEIDYDKDRFFITGDDNGHIIHLTTGNNNIPESLYDKINNKVNYLFLVDFSINYTRGTDDTDEHYFVTSWFPIRIIDDIYLADVLNDFILKPRFRSPVLIILNNNNDTEKPEFHLYIDTGSVSTDIENGGGVYVKLNNDLYPHKIRFSYIAKPAIVQFNDDNEGVSVDCNLPEYMHVDIVKHAVDLYHVALQGSLMSAQQAQQAQQRENVRNNARNDN